jgi:hypothetical protein
MFREGKLKRYCYILLISLSYIKHEIVKVIRGRLLVEIRVIDFVELKFGSADLKIRGQKKILYRKN